MNRSPSAYSNRNTITDNTSTLTQIKTDIIFTRSTNAAVTACINKYVSSVKIGLHILLCRTSQCHVTREHYAVG